ncbi:MAG TPA: hypothetical protein DCL80_06405 [Balneola sp.]|nr:hypothetical protein [Bacteroidota bacterium]MAC04402.1 hypothetical protein [Balneola sp.]MAO78418.1 hypothetical protein [Balneola sp.]MBF64418.1 hypothetical protein [Balneola sp.]HAH50908.1 hypothetical protein [Balneola sp.]|tara:strand:- start:32090 stop:34033 length:1944 start_codon:yes stop_codon:yes gene_type:complete
MCSTGVFSQSADSTKTDSVQITNSETTLENKNAISVQNNEKKVTRVNLWKNRMPSFSNMVTNDSLLRWNIYPNWGDYYAYRNNTISFRQGTIGRIDAFNIAGYDQYEQKLWLDDILLNDPVSGLINYNYVPHHKISSVFENHSGNFNSYINIRDYYITEPISYLNFDEASNDYRNLEFFVSQNTAPGTNIEVSYWDRRDGGFYPNNTAEGSQIMGRIYHHIGDKYQFQGMILRNDFNNDESGGYVINDPAAFSFGEFTSQPRSSSGSSEVLRNDIKVGLYQREDTTASESGAFILSRMKNDRAVKIASDTLSREIVSHKARAFKKINAGLFSTKADISVSHSKRKNGNSISRTNWMTLNAEVSTELILSKKLKLFASGEYISRNTQHTGSLFSTGIGFGSNDGFNGKIVGSHNDEIPTIQTLYWSSKNYSGNSNLRNERTSSVYGEANIPIGSFLKLGVSGRLKLTKDRVIIDRDSTFSNLKAQDFAFGSAYIRFENHRLELESSTGYETTLRFDSDQDHSAFGSVGTKFWIRNSFFYKNYAFNRAAYLKLGVRTLLSPVAYESQFYNTELNYWQSNSLTSDESMQFFVPAFFRLDAELSARVRAIMVVIRWENALDGLGQAGYFETASFPMPPRRLIVGIRAQFRN